MKTLPAQPSLYQINTRVWLTELSRSLGRPATLDDIPDAELDRLAEMGFDWIWLLSVWQTGPAAQQVSRSHPGMAQRVPGKPCRGPARRRCSRVRALRSRAVILCMAIWGAIPVWPGCASG